MYKKISHNIVEEHFDHPMAFNVMQSQWPPSPNKFAFISSIKNQFIAFETDLRSYIKSELLDSTDNTFNWKQLINTVNQFGSFFLPYYGQAIANNVVDYFTSYINSVSDIVKAVKSGQDIVGKQELALTHLISFVQLVTAIDPTWWTPMGIKPEDSMADYNQQTVEQIISRNAQDWETDYNAAELAFNIIALGGGNKAPYNVIPDFSTILGNSIVRKFPSKFA